MIREFCDRCGTEFKYPVMKGGVVTFRRIELYEATQYMLCTRCYEEVNDTFLTVYSTDPAKLDVDDEMFDAYEEQQKRVLENDEMSGERI
jgi:hypothetical protein